MQEEDLKKFNTLKLLTQEALGKKAIKLCKINASVSEYTPIAAAIIYESLGGLDQNSTKDNINDELKKIEFLCQDTLDNSRIIDAFAGKIKNRMTNVQTPQQAFEDIMEYEPGWFWRFINWCAEKLSINTEKSLKDNISSISSSGLHRIAQERQEQQIIAAQQERVRQYTLRFEQQQLRQQRIIAEQQQQQKQQLIQQQKQQQLIQQQQRQWRREQEQMGLKQLNKKLEQDILKKLLYLQDSSGQWQFVIEKPTMQGLNQTRLAMHNDRCYFVKDLENGQLFRNNNSYADRRSEVARAAILRYLLPKNTTKYILLNKGHKEYVASKAVKTHIGDFEGNYVPSKEHPKTLYDYVSKREAENNNSLEEALIAELLADNTGDLLKQYIKIQLVNFAVGNHDAHFDNIMVKTSKDGKRKLVVIDFDNSFSTTGKKNFDELAAKLISIESNIIHQVKEDLQKEFSKPQQLKTLCKLLGDKRDECEMLRDREINIEKWVKMVNKTMGTNIKFDF